MKNDKDRQNTEERINRTISLQTDWNKHVNHQCPKCMKCNCGKHKCEIKSPQLGLSPYPSTYQSTYTKRKNISLNQKTNKVVSLDTYEPLKIIDKSLYKAQYVDKISASPKVKMQIYQDNIKLGGPSFNTTTYQAAYIQPYCERESPIKNPQNLANTTKGAKMQATSNYKQCYKGYTDKNLKKEQPIKHLDNLKVEANFFTPQSSYSSHYSIFKNYKRDKTNFAPNRVYESKKALKTQTSYHQHYNLKPLERCPAQSY